MHFVEAPEEFTILITQSESSSSTDEYSRNYHASLTRLGNVMSLNAGSFNRSPIVQAVGSGMHAFVSLGIETAWFVVLTIKFNTHTQKNETQDID